MAAGTPPEPSCRILSVTCAKPDADFVGSWLTTGKERLTPEEHSGWPRSLASCNRSVSDELQFANFSQTGNATRLVKLWHYAKYGLLGARDNWATLALCVICGLSQATIFSYVGVRSRAAGQIASASEVGRHGDRGRPMRYHRTVCYRVVVNCLS